MCSDSHSCGEFRRTYTCVCLQTAVCASALCPALSSYHAGCQPQPRQHQQHQQRLEFTPTPPPSSPLSTTARRPIQLLRVFVSVFFMVFYIASLGVFLVAINCQWLNGAPYSVAAFPEVECLAMPHMIHMAVAIVLMILFIIITIAATAADFELNPTSPRWLAAATSSVEVRVVMVRTVATLAFSLLPGLRRPETLLIACSVFYAFWLFVRYQPHMVQWINHTRAAIFGSLSWAAFLLLVLTFSGRAFEDVQFSETCTTAMLAGILPFGLLSFGISYLRYRWHYTKALKAFAAAPPDMNIREVRPPPTPAACSLIMPQVPHFK